MLSSTVCSSATNKQQNKTYTKRQQKQTKKTTWKCKEDVTLESETAHSNLLVSENKKSTTFVNKR